MNAFQFFRDEHKRIIGLLRQARASLQRTPDRVVDIGKEIRMELDIYFQIKKEFIYPSLEEDTLSNTLSGDQEVLGRLKELDRAVDTDPRKVPSLILEITPQVEECFSNEEHEIFPLLNTIPAESLIQKQNKLRQLPEYVNSQPEIAQNPEGGEQQRKRRVA